MRINKTILRILLKLQVDRIVAMKKLSERKFCCESGIRKEEESQYSITSDNSVCGSTTQT